ncbi:MAG TPA: prepilin-type N-terminal cleavage/methylation domain-containing protein [Polyangiaceae bacterium]|jgi:prepilin-type N-terminal cleavage/methylation domain-containing protein
MKTTRRRGGTRGYTAVELMMSIAIFGIGLTGIAAMQKVVAVSNMHAKNLSIATHIAESWLDVLNADAAQWNSPSPTVATQDRTTDTEWLKSVVTNPGSGGWVLPNPAYSTHFQFGSYFDALGNPQQLATGAAFCTNIRLSWLYQETQGNGLIRAEVRVYWLRDGQSSVTANTNPCLETPDNVTAGASHYHFVQKVTALKENT